MSEVADELRPGEQSVVKESLSEHNAVVSGVPRMNKQLSTMHEKLIQTMNEKLAQMEHKHQTNYANLKNDIESIKELIVHGKRSREFEPQQCSKRCCGNLVGEQFSSGKPKKQCAKCIRVSNQAYKRAKAPA
jgi:phage host-nuclease inhibitor protein Gam